MAGMLGYNVGKPVRKNEEYGRVMFAILKYFEILKKVLKHHLSV